MIKMRLRTLIAFLLGVFLSASVKSLGSKAKAKV